MNINHFIVSEENTIIEVMQIIDKNAKGVAFICKDSYLIGVVTDGDIRRYILRSGDLNCKIKGIANYTPKFLKTNDKEDYLEFMKRHSITAVPIVGQNNKILTIRFLHDKQVPRNKELNIPVVIMAGGKGTRLYPYTQILPKPLIPVGEKTITELIMDQFEVFGCTKFDMIVNYKKNLIKSFFLDSENKRDIDFIVEEEFLGTGGGLKLLEGRYKETFFVTNCDIIIEEDYSEIVKYHRNHKNLVTMVCAMKNITVPYGTIELGENGEVAKLNEKPTFNYLTNTGLYVIEPEFLDMIPDNTFIHITDIIQNCIDSKQKVGVYPISENAWMDMGQLEELDKMRERLMNDGRG